MKHYAFLSYRRRDSATVARWVASTLELAYGADSVFIDTEKIRLGETWPDMIHQALERATALVVIIGPSWLKSADRHGVRCLDKQDDWVRNEILHALSKKIRVVPLLVTGGELPEQDALPECVRGVRNYQALELRDGSWDEDLSRLLVRLDELGFERISPSIQFPIPVVREKALDQDEINDALGRLRDWKLMVSPLPGDPLKRRTEIVTKYVFDSFEDAVHFMTTASRHISKANHHPRWENTWRTITVALTTWDIGHKPSEYDIELAQYLDWLYERYMVSDLGLITHRPGGK